MQQLKPDEYLCSVYLIDLSAMSHSYVADNNQKIVNYDKNQKQRSIVSKRKYYLLFHNTENNSYSVRSEVTIN